MHDPIPMFLTCPRCNAQHIDEGEFATKMHHTHSCQQCGLTWRPAVGPTVGVQFLPGFKNDPVGPDNAPSVDFTPTRHAQDTTKDRSAHPVHEGPCCLDLLTSVVSMEDAVRWMVQWHAQARGYLGWEVSDPCETWLLREACEYIIDTTIDEEGKARRREEEETQRNTPGPRQIGGPDQESGLPSHYRLNRWIRDTGEVFWIASAVDPMDHETMGLGPQKLDTAVRECQRHAEAVTRPARVEAVRAERERVEQSLHMMHEKYANGYHRSITPEFRAGILEGIKIGQFCVKPEREK